MLCRHRRSSKLVTQACLLWSRQERMWKLTTPPHLHPQRNWGSLEGTAEPWPCDQLAGCLVHLVHWLAPGCVPSLRASSGQVNWALGLNELHGGDASSQKAMLGVTHAWMLQARSLAVRGNCVPVCPHPQTIAVLVYVASSGTAVPNLTDPITLM